MEKSWVELWDTESGNLVGEFDGVIDAVADLRKSMSPQVRAWLPSLALVLKSRDGSFSEVILDGEGFVTLFQEDGAIASV